MTRLGPLPREAMTAEQRDLMDAILSGPRGSLAGPFEPWLRSPELGDRAQALGEFCRFYSSLEPRLAELAIILTGAHWRSQFEFWFHANKAREYGLPDDVIEDIRAGKAPRLMDRGERAVYALVSEYLATTRVRDETYREAVEVLSERGVVDLVGIVGYYGLVSMTLNVFEVGLPEGAEPPFTEQ